MALDAGSFSTAGATIQESAQNPAWYQEGLADLLGQGTQLYDLYKNQAQTPYTGQVVAPTTALQQQAQTGTSSLANQYQSPATIGGLSALQSGANQLGLAGQNLQNVYGQAGMAMNPYISSMGATAGQLGSLAGQYPGATSPYLSDIGAARGDLTSLQGQMGASINPYQTGLSSIASSLGSLGTQARTANQPYQNTLGAIGAQLAGQGQYNASNLNQFMNPYTNTVVNRIAELGNRNLTENILPGVQSQFGGAGQFGSKRMMDFQNRALRDSQEGILAQQGQALNQGYQQAQQSYADWANRGMQGLGQQAGLVGQQAQLGQQGVTQQSQLMGQQAGLLGQQAGLAQGTLQQQANLAAQRAGLSGQQAQLAQGSLQGQAGLLGQQAGLYGQQAGLAQYGLGQQANLAGQQAQLGGQMGQFGTQQTATGLAANQALNQLGNEDWGRLQQQNAFDLAQWNAQQQAPWQTFGWLSNITRGLQPGQVGGVSYSIPGTTQPVAPSISQMLGGLGQMASTVK